ncbi:hypothetical protein GN956_G18921 [Arapaima gigas]
MSASSATRQTRAIALLSRTELRQDPQEDSSGLGQSGVDTSQVYCGGAELMLGLGRGSPQELAAWDISRNHTEVSSDSGKSPATPTSSPRHPALGAETHSQDEHSKRGDCTTCVDLGEVRYHRELGHF